MSARGLALLFFITASSSAFAGSRQPFIAWGVGGSGEPIGENPSCFGVSEAEGATLGAAEGRCRGFDGSIRLSDFDYEHDAELCRTTASALFQCVPSGERSYPFVVQGRIGFCWGGVPGTETQAMSVAHDRARSRCGGLLQPVLVSPFETEPGGCGGMYLSFRGTYVCEHQ